jgi:DNA polymerase elongation subunit (family B)
MSKKNKPKVLIFDIETSPNLAYVWGMWEQNVIEYEKQWEMLCFAYKWLGERRVTAIGTNTLRGGEKELVERLWKLFDEADIIIAHNGDNFDIKKSNAKFLEYGMLPPSHYKTVDTLKVSRKYFKLNSNRLEALGKLLKVGKKLPHTGFDIWLGCMNNDKKSWKTMLAYNKQDVVLLEKVYLSLRSWMNNHPNSNVVTGHTHNCPTCSSTRTQKRGFSVTRVNKYQRYQCQDCGAWSTGEIIKREKGNKVILK